MTVRTVFALIFALYILAFTFHATYVGETIYGDGRFYFNWLQVILGQADIFQGNKYSIGPALFWLPFYKLFPFTLAVGFSSVFYAIAGLVLLYRLLVKTFSQSVSLLTVFLIAFSSNLLFYGAVDPANSHSISFFTVITFLSFLYEKKKDWILIGISLGLIGTVRPQDMIVGLLARRVRLRAFLLGFLIGVFPQLLAWAWLYGSPIALPYLGRGEGFSIAPQNILGVLFLPANGLFLWTPITLFGLIGLVLYKKTFALLFLIQLFIVGSWSTWWQGASYSGRMLVGTLPLLAFGISEITSKIRIPIVALYLLGMSLSVINALLIVYFLISS